jgi:hypothetical protein
MWYYFIYVGRGLKVNKILFLDVDGVLNSHRDVIACGSRDALNIGSMQLLREVIDTTGCKVVITSDWQKYPDSMRRLFSTKFLTFNDLHQSGETAQLNNRGKEIDSWLLNNPFVDCYAIIDDIDAMMGYQRKRLVLTNSKRGLCRDHADQLIALLGAKK